MKKILAISVILIAANASFAAKKCQTERKVYYNTSETKVWATTICPQEFLPYHTHQTTRIIIPQQNGKLKVLYKKGGSEYVNLVKNKPELFSKEEGMNPHQDINVGLKRIRVVVVEIKAKK